MTRSGATSQLCEHTPEKVEDWFEDVGHLGKTRDVRPCASAAWTSQRFVRDRDAAAPVSFIKALSVFDMQAWRTSRCQFPAPETPNEEGWYYWFGDKGGTTADDFDVKTFLSAGR